MILTRQLLLTLGACAGLSLFSVACGDKAESKTEAKAESDESDDDDKGDKKKKKGKDKDKKDKGEKAAATATASGTASAAAAVPPPPSPLPPVELKDPKALSFGGKEVSAEICKLDTGAPTMASDNFDRAIRGVAAGPGGLVYVLDHEGKLRRYKASSGACELSLDKGFGEGGVLALEADKEQSDRFDTLAIDDKGDVYVSGFIAKAKKVSNGTVTALCKSSGRLYVDPASGAAYSGSDKVDLADCKETPTGIDFGKDVRADMLVGFGADVAAVYNVKENNKNVYKVGLFAGKTKKWAVGDADGDGQMCNVGAVAPCALGLCVVDANCRSLKVVDKGGKLLGAGKINDLIGLSYPWPRGISVTKNGAYLAATHRGKEKDDKFNYGMVFRLKGL